MFNTKNVSTDAIQAEMDRLGVNFFYREYKEDWQLFVEVGYSLDPAVFFRGEDCQVLAQFL